MFRSHRSRRSGATRRRIPLSASTPCFNPHRSRTSGATTCIRPLLFPYVCFNPHRSRRSGATVPKSDFSARNSSYYWVFSYSEFAVFCVGHLLSRSTPCADLTIESTSLVVRARLSTVHRSPRICPCRSIPGSSLVRLSSDISSSCPV